MLTDEQVVRLRRRYVDQAASLKEYAAEAARLRGDTERAFAMSCEAVVWLQAADWLDTAEREGQQQGKAG